MHVIFVEPFFPRNQREFARALREAGAFVTGIGEASHESLPSDLRGWLNQYEQVSSVCNVNEMVAAVRRVQSRGWVDRLEATVEAHILPTAQVRAACTIPGTSYEAAYKCRDKPTMKAELRKHGIPCAQSTAAGSGDDVRAFVAAVGLPVIVKPRDGAGASGTFKCSSAAELERAIEESQVGVRGRSVAVEEFIEGHEGFFDTLTIGGNVVLEFVTHYFPNVLEAMRTRWISPQFITTNRLETEGYGELRQLGRQVVRALELGTTATHMEWFYGPKGLKFSEIGCRPPGVGAWDLYCAANEFDLYREWANAICHGRILRQPSRRFSAGIINLRPTQDGVIQRYEGYDTIQQWFGQWIIDAHLPAPGQRTQGVEAGYMANAWLRMKHPDYDELRRMLNAVGETVKVIAG